MSGPSAPPDLNVWDECAQGCTLFILVFALGCTFACLFVIFMTVVIVLGVCKKKDKKLINTLSNDVNDLKHENGLLQKTATEKQQQAADAVHKLRQQDVELNGQKAELQTLVQIANAERESALESRHTAMQSAEAAQAREEEMSSKVSGLESEQAQLLGKMSKLALGNIFKQAKIETLEDLERAQFLLMEVWYVGFDKISEFSKRNEERDKASVVSDEGKRSVFEVAVVKRVFMAEQWVSVTPNLKSDTKRCKLLPFVNNNRKDERKQISQKANVHPSLRNQNIEQLPFLTYRITKFTSAKNQESVRITLLFLHGMLEFDIPHNTQNGVQVALWDRDPQDNWACIFTSPILPAPESESEQENICDLQMTTLQHVSKEGDEPNGSLEESEGGADYMSSHEETPSALKEKIASLELENAQLIEGLANSSEDSQKLLNALNLIHELEGEVRYWKSVAGAS